MSADRCRKEPDCPAGERAGSTRNSIPIALPLNVAEKMDQVINATEGTHAQHELLLILILEIISPWQELQEQMQKEE